MWGSKVITHIALYLTSHPKRFKNGLQRPVHCNWCHAKERWSNIDINRPGFLQVPCCTVYTNTLSLSRTRCAELSCGSCCEGTVGFWTKALFNQSAVIARVTDIRSLRTLSFPASRHLSFSPLSLLLPLFKTPPAGAYRPTVLVFQFCSPTGNWYDCLSFRLFQNILN